jgi:transposase InsO family protein
VTNLAEVIHINNKSFAHISIYFENNWLAWYPRPSCCIHDNGGEFTGAVFLHMLRVNGIKDVTTTVKNPQANAICERLHQSISNTLQTMLHTYPPNTIDQTNDIMDTCFATAAYASKVAIHHTLDMSPGALVFQRDMILNISLITDLLHLHERRQIIIGERLRRANLYRRTFDYQPGDEILILTNNPTTL